MKEQKDTKLVNKPVCADKCYSANEDDISLRHILREMVFGYVFWCLFQGLAPAIWFYPLNDLEISGYEIFALLWFTQIFTGIPLFLVFVQNQHVISILRVLCVVALLSFQAPTTFVRLATLAVGNGFATITLTALLWSPSSRIRATTCWGLLLGFIAFVTSRIWFVSFVPTWWSSQSNTFIVTLCLIAVIDQYISGFDKIEESQKEASFNKQVARPPWFTTAIGFGSLLYLMNWVFGEVSLITRWTVRPYPFTGPQPYPWGACTLVALCFGAYMSWCRHIATSKIWWFIGLAAFLALYYLPAWNGFTGGIILAVYAMSIWPEMTDRVTRCPPARTLFLAILMFMLQNFLLVWTVAYNFVPLGEYTRERTFVLIAINMFFIFLGLFTGGPCNDESFTAFIKWSSKKLQNGFNSVLALLLFLGLLGFCVRYSPDRYNHQSKNPKILTTAIWTYHFGYDNKGWPSLERAAVLLNDSGADIVTMLESDASKPFLGNNDLGMWLEEKMGFYVDFGPSTRDHTWGNLILSKYPFVKSTHHLLPSPYGELAPAVSATVNVSGRLVDLVVTHMGNDRDKLDRKLQAEFLAKECKNSENPVIFMGYITSKPGSNEYNELINTGHMKDIDETDKKRFCQYIMYRGLKRLGYARITHGGLSDTEVQMARFEIPDNAQDYKDNSAVTYDTVTIPTDVLFNEKFGSLHHGHGFFPDHRFHMSTPKYFLP